MSSFFYLIDQKIKIKKKLSYVNYLLTLLVYDARLKKLIDEAKMVSQTYFNEISPEHKLWHGYIRQHFYDLFLTSTKKNNCIKLKAQKLLLTKNSDLENICLMINYNYCYLHIKIKLLHKLVKTKKITLDSAVTKLNEILASHYFRKQLDEYQVHHPNWQK